MNERFCYLCLHHVFRQLLILLKLHEQVVDTDFSQQIDLFFYLFFQIVAWIKNERAKRKKSGPLISPDLGPRTGPQVYHP